MVSPVIKSGSALVRPDRQMFLREKKAIFPFILSGLFDPEGMGAETRRPAYPAGGHAPSASINILKQKYVLLNLF
ncbi:Holliday junction DNA helicase motor protein [Bacillus sp. SG-1]|nr:Holliday junction DNA helicase motor protein [Bacillus sp. SG-1]